MRHAGAQFGEIAQFLFRQVDLPEQRIGKNLIQLGKEAVLVGAGEVAQIEVIGLGQPHQKLRRHRALVPLYQVDIARGNAEALSDLGLRQPQLLPDAPEARADEQLFSRLSGHRGSAPICDKIYKVTFITCRYVTSHHHSYASHLYEIRSFAFSSQHVSRRSVTNV